MATRTITVSNKKVFAVDAATGFVQITPAELNSISNFTLTIDEPAGPRWIPIDVDYTDFSAAATTNNVEIYSLAAGSIIHAVIVRTTTPFTGGAISAYTLSVGITGTATKYSAAADVFAGTQEDQLASALIPESWTAATSIKGFATSTTANLSAATAGAATIYLLVSEAEEE